MTEEQLREAVRSKAVGGRVACKALLEMAAETGTAPADLGRICNELGIKIRECQLGCFK